MAKELLPIDERFEITEHSYRDFVEGASPAALAMIYTISKYHEKYRVTQWTLDSLKKLGYTEEDLKHFDSQFMHFYNQLLIQDDL